MSHYASFFLFKKVLLQVFPSPTPSVTGLTTFDYGGPFDLTGAFIKTIFAMIIVIAAALLLIRYVLPKIAVGRPRNRQVDMKVLDRLPLDPKKALYVVEIEDRRLLVGASENHLSLITELEKHAKRSEKNPE